VRSCEALPALAQSPTVHEKQVRGLDARSFCSSAVLLDLTEFFMVVGEGMQLTPSEKLLFFD